MLATFWADGDGDGFGNALFAAEACEPATGYVENADDCDDTSAAASPEGTETCEGTDEDCDGTVDEGEWYADTDGDGFGNPDALDTTCLMPVGFVADWSDCDDSKGDVSPNGIEVCGGADEDGADKDCDGLTDDADASVTGEMGWYADADGDGWGTGGVILACLAPSGAVGVVGDCDDTKGDVSPDGVEVCGGGDEDCDALVDDADPDLTGGTTWFVDGDSDGHGTAAGTTSACLQPAGFAASSDDCDDSEGTISPSALETCNDGIDQDCDGADAPTCDADGDGYQVGVDCDDTNAAINPGGRELCDAANADEDCDGLTDNDDSTASVSTKARFYADTDGDGFGGTASTLKCDAPTGYVANEDDCDDSNAAISPAATEVCSTAVDDDCSGENSICEPFDVDDAATRIDGAASGIGIVGLAAGDFSGTGDIQIVVGSPLVNGAMTAGTVHVLGWAGEASISGATPMATLDGTGAPSNMCYGTYLFAGDSDCDGLDDLFIDNSEYSTAGGEFVYGGDIGSNAAILDVSAATIEGYGPIPADMNGDGLMDVVAMFFESSGWSVGTALGPIFGDYPQNNTTALDFSIAGFANAAGFEVAAGDLNGDGESDLAVGHNANFGPSLSIFEGAATATDLSQAGVTFSVSPAATALAFGDLDHDGSDELIVVRYCSYSDGVGCAVYVVRDFGVDQALTDAAAATFDPQERASSSPQLVVADFDGDGGAELAFGDAYLDGYSGLVYVFES